MIGFELYKLTCKIKYSKLILWKITAAYCWINWNGGDLCKDTIVFLADAISLMVSGRQKRSFFVDKSLLIEEINKKISISGLKKQDYFIQMLLNHEVKLVSDYRLSDNMAKEIFQLAKVIKKFGKLNDDEADILIYILEIYEEIKKEKSPYYKE